MKYRKYMDFFTINPVNHFVRKFFKKNAPKIFEINFGKSKRISQQV